jgi:AcrR family transcriptional regulator/transposase-like protein
MSSAVRDQLASPRAPRPYESTESSRTLDPQAPDAVGDDACLEWLWIERFSLDGRHAECPSCQRTRRFHRVRGRASYSCDSCGHHVFARVGTPFERSRLSLQLWFRAVRDVERDPSIDARMLAARLGTTITTADRMRERIAVHGVSSDGPLLNRIAAWVDRWPDAADGASPIESRRDVSNDIRPRILDATIRAIVRRGYPDVRMRDVAAEANVSTAAIHYHFSTKNDLLFAALQRSMRNWFDVLDAVVRSDDDPVHKLAAALLYATIDSPDRVDQIVWMELARLALRDPIWASEMERLCLRWDARLRAIVQEGVDKGRFACAGTVDDAVIRIQGLIDGLAERVMLAYDDSSSDRVRRLIREAAAREVGVEPDALAPRSE